MGDERDPPGAGAGCRIRISRQFIDRMRRELTRRPRPIFCPDFPKGAQKPRVERYDKSTLLTCQPQCPYAAKKCPQPEWRVWCLRLFVVVEMAALNVAKMPGAVF